MFTSQMHFLHSSSAYSLVFIDPSIALFLGSSTDNSSSLDEPSTAASDFPNSTTDPSTASHPPEPSHEPRHFDRVRAPPAHLHDYHCFSVLATLHEPHSYREASANPLWQKAMSDELDAFSKTHTWDLVDLPPGGFIKLRLVQMDLWNDIRLVLLRKALLRSMVLTMRRLFAPVARLTSVRSLLAVVAVRHWQLFQMDVKNAFLNGDLTEEVYMHPPPGYHHPPHKVCRLRRALYGLKQAPCAWFAKFDFVVAQQGFVSSAYNSALFLQTTDAGTILILLYVDDMIIIGDEISGIRALQSFLSQNFEMKDLGTLSYFLGLEVTSSTDGYYLSQAKYAFDLLSQAGLTGSKTMSNPLETNVKLLATDGEPLSDATLYRQLVGSLIYLTVTRLDIAYAVHLVSQFMSAPRSIHYVAILCILRYVKGTVFHGLHFILIHLLSSGPTC
jgi:hypothetical protein